MSRDDLQLALLSLYNKGYCLVWRIESMLSLVLSNLKSRYLEWQQTTHEKRFGFGPVLLVDQLRKIMNCQ